MFKKSVAIVISLGLLFLLSSIVYSQEPTKVNKISYIIKFDTQIKNIAVITLKVNNSIVKSKIIKLNEVTTKKHIKCAARGMAEKELIEQLIKGN